MLQRKLLFPAPSFIFSEATTKPSHQDLELSFPIAPAGLVSHIPPAPALPLHSDDGPPLIFPPVEECHQTLIR